MAVYIILGLLVLIAFLVHIALSIPEWTQAKNQAEVQLV